MSDDVMKPIIRHLEWEGNSDTERCRDYMISPSYGQGPKPWMLSRGSKLLGWYDEKWLAKVAAHGDNEAYIYASIDFPEYVRAALDAEKEAHAETQSALRGFIADLDAANARADAAEAEARFCHKLLGDAKTRIEAAEARVARLDSELSQFAEANHKQANCIHRTAQALGPDFSPTCDALPKAAAYVVSRADAAEAALNTAREAMDEIAVVVGCLEGKDSLDKELIRNIKESLALINPQSGEFVTQKEPRT